jgi:hypothetical protein
MALTQDVEYALLVIPIVKKPGFFQRANISLLLDQIPVVDRVVFAGTASQPELQIYRTPNGIGADTLRIIVEEALRQSTPWLLP